jgi:subtilisin family serine protease
MRRNSHAGIRTPRDLEIRGGALINCAARAGTTPAAITELPKMQFFKERGGAAMSLSALAAALLAACGGGSTSDGPTESAAAAKAVAKSDIAIAARGASEGVRGGSVKADGQDRGSAKLSSKLYIVQLAEKPVLGYQGGIAGYAATKPAKGSKLDSSVPAVQSYFSYLTARHDAVLAGAGAAGKKSYSYGFAFNGFAAELTEAQAAKLAATPGVLGVVKDEIRKIATTNTPTFLGLTGPNGFYAQTGASGEGIVVGVIDTGIWPEHPSFAAGNGPSNSNGTGAERGWQKPRGWNGTCESGEQFSQTYCNGKIVGARYYNAGIGGPSTVQKFLPWEFNSPRDFNGHGSHTASTAAGNANVPTNGLAAVFGVVNGIAPRARIAAYKVCWHIDGDGSCATTDSVAAIDQAVADGVDVLNFSIGGTQTNFLDPVEVAFLFAADAGIFVASSAGNDGPGASTVEKPGPWLTTVAAGTHNRDGVGSVTLGNGATYTGGSLANALSSRSIIDAAAAPAAGASAPVAELCTPGSLNAAAVAGKIVLCKRGGGIALVDKTGEVAAKGGAGAVIWNDPAGATNTFALMHLVPTVHVVAASGQAIKAYIAGAGAPTASIAKAELVFNVPAPLAAAFSGRGPIPAAGGDVLKPDIMAPGQDIMAASAPPGTGGEMFDLKSGTSMSTPHVAGLAALMKELRPTWSPMAIKSALMTTAGDVLDGPNTSPEVIFSQGAGHVRPIRMNDPGLVFDHDFDDWLAFLCGTGQLTSAGCAAIRIDPSDLNVPSIAIGDLAGLQTVKRRVTNVTSQSATYTPSVAGMAGFDVVVQPRSLVVPAGQTREFTVAFTRTAATANVYTGGQLTLSDGPHSVRIPLVVRPVALSAPPEVAAQVGGTSYNVVFGYSGSFSATPRGLVAATVTAGNVADDPTDGTCSLTVPNAVKVEVAVPAGTTYARFATFDADANAGSDIDLCVFRGTTLVGASTTATATEAVNLVNPVAATYTVVVHGWGVAGTTPFKLHHWLLGGTSAGNMTVTAPTTATLGQTGTIQLGFSGLEAGKKYLGSVAYDGTAGLPNPTIVRVDP